MRRKILWTLTGLISILFLSLGGVLTTSTGLSVLIKTIDYFLKDSISARSVTGALLRGLQVEEFEFLAEGQHVSLDKLSVSIRPAQIFQGRLVIASLDAEGLSIDFESQGEATSLPEISLPFPVQIDKAGVENIAIGSASEAATTTIRSINLNTAAMEASRLTVGQFDIVTDVFQVQAGGELETTAAYPLDLALAYTVNIAGYAPISGRGTLGGTLDKLIIDTQAVAPYDAAVTGHIAKPLEQPVWTLRLESPETALDAIHPSWPQLALSDLMIKGSGTMESYGLDVNSKGVYGSDAAAMELTGRIEGDGQGLHFTNLEFTREGGRCRGSGSMSWHEEFAWQAELDTTDFDPSLFAPQWPGRLQGKVRTAGRLSGEGPVLNLQVQGLSGKLRGYPVTGQCRLNLDGQQGAVEELKLQSGSTVLRVRGEWNEHLDLDFRLESENLAEAWPGAGGRLNIGGQVKGTLQAPVVNCDLSGRNLIYQDYALSLLSGKATGSLNGGDIDVSLTGEQFQTDGFEADRIDLVLAGSRKQHHLDIELDHALGQAELRLSGALNGMAWQGVIEELAVRSSQYGEWNQEEESKLSLASQAVQFDTLCLSTEDDDKVCIQGHWDSKEGWLVDSQVAALTLTSLENITGRQFPLEGALAGSLLLQGDGVTPTKGSLQVDASATDIKKELPPTLMDRLNWKTNQLSLTLEEQRLTGSLDVLLPGESFVQASVAMDQFEFTTLFDRDLTGQVNIQLNAVEDLAPLVGRYVLPSGSLEGKLSIKGSLSTPGIAGSVALSRGKAGLPGLGITLDPLKLSINGDYQLLNVKVSGASDGGSLVATASCDLSKGFDQSVEIAITGDHFEAVDLPEYRLSLSPDLRFIVNRDRGDLTGTVVIDDAWIGPQNGNGSLKSSRDVIVVDDEELGSRDAWPFYSDVTLRAGDAVHVDAFGLSGRITGSLQVIDQPSRLQTGIGTLQIEDGAFTVYGRQLQIGVGRLYFTGGPLDDPGVEVRAETREEGVTTGVEVVGFLRNPEISFYSDPYMEQHEILSRLLTSASIGGSSRDDTGTIGQVAEKMGLGELATVMKNSKELLNIDDIKVETEDSFSNISLIIGSWLTPRFYVSYGRNLLKESGSFNTRYTIGKGFYLKTETGSNQSGGDIKYEFER